MDLRRMRDGVRVAEQTAYASILEERVTPSDEELPTDEALGQWLLRNSGTSMGSSAGSLLLLLLLAPLGMIWGLKRRGLRKRGSVME